MYWTHLIFVLLYGVTHWCQTTATKPGYLDFDNLPETNFSCDKKVIGGYYADVETGCQMFHVCTIGQKGEITDIKFLCLNGTVFDQETRVCERIDEVDCSKSEDFFGLNLELYGNNANLGIQPENEFDCEDCSTDDDYEESEETTTFATPTTSTTTTTTPKPTTTTTTTRPGKYQTSSQETIAALLALHNAFNQGLQSSKVKPPPPRVINNAFSPTKSTPKPYTTYATQRSSSSFKPVNFNADSQSFGSLNLQQQERPYYFTPTTERTNYHHFHSGDTSFGHSYDSTRPYNFQYFHARKLPEVQGTISVVTSTSTSTSVRTSKGNTTIEYPTGYEDYQDDIHEVHDSFFADVPKIRQKRTSDKCNSTQLQEPSKQFDKYYSIENKNNAREEFLQNLLNSIDIEDRVREKMSNLFKKEETEIEKIDDSGRFLMNLGNKLKEMIKHEHYSHETDEIQESARISSEWKRHFNDMSKDINLNYTFETNLKDVEYKISRKKRETPTNVEIKRVTGLHSPPTRRPLQRRTQQATTTEQQRSSRRKVIRQKIDTEKFNFETSRKNHGQHESKPVSETIENDFTTVEYRKTSRKGREQPRATTSSRKTLKFNYETTTAFSELERKPAAGQRFTRVRENRYHQHADISPAEEGTPSSAPAHLHSTRASRVQVEHYQQHTGVTPPEIAVTPIPSSDGLQTRRITRVHDELHRHVGVAPKAVTSIPNSSSADLQTTRAARVHEELFHQHSVAATPAVSTTPKPAPSGRRSRGRPRTTESTTTSSTITTSLSNPPDPNFSCEGKVKGGFYADLFNDCRGFFICSQGIINGPLLKTHFWCGETTKFNQRSRTCQAENLVECSVSTRYFHLNNDFLVPAPEDELKGSFEPMKVS